jgi:hypothetical protein
MLNGRINTLAGSAAETLPIETIMSRMMVENIDAVCFFIRKFGLL